jgi:hypothetical protein
MQENYLPNRREQFLWWLSTAESVLLKDAVVDRNRHSIIGMLVLGTWSFATLAWTYFFSTVIDHWGIACLLGIFMGGMILFIDRALIKGINHSGKQGWKPLIFRFFLAYTIGLFMAQPALLFLFEKEILVQSSLDNEIKKRNKYNDLEKLYSPQKKQLLIEKNQLNAMLAIRYQEMIQTSNQFIKESDGTGGSKKIGLKAIALAKKAAAEKAAEDYNQIAKTINPSIKQIDSSIQLINQKITTEQNSFNQLLNNGFITRIEALDHLVKQSNAVKFRYYLLILLLMLIELMPVLSKYLLPSGTYALNAKLTEENEMEELKKINRNEPTDSF